MLRLCVCVCVYILCFYRFIKGTLAPSPTPWCSSYRKGSLRGHPRLWSLTLLFRINKYTYRNMRKSPEYKKNNKYKIQ